MLRRTEAAPERRTLRFLPATLFVVAAALSACNAGLPPNTEVIDNPATAPVRVDPAEAARMLSEIRAEQGLPPVTASATLTAIAQDYADVLAAAGVVDHHFGSTLAGRLDEGGYVWAIAAENLGGGYRSLAEAFARWEASRSHRENLFAPDVTEIGIATAFNIDSPYRTFWVLLLGRPPG